MFRYLQGMLDSVAEGNNLFQDATGAGFEPQYHGRSYRLGYRHVMSGDANKDRICVAVCWSTLRARCAQTGEGIGILECVE